MKIVKILLTFSRLSMRCFSSLFSALKRFFFFFKLKCKQLIDKSRHCQINLKILTLISTCSSCSSFLRMENSFSSFFIRLGLYLTANARLRILSWSFSCLIGNSFWKYYRQEQNKWLDTEVESIQTRNGKQYMNNNKGLRLSLHNKRLWFDPVDSYSF